MVWFYAGEELPFSIGYFYLFFVAEEDVLGAVVHEVNRVDGLVVGRSYREQFPVETHIV